MKAIVGGVAFLAGLVMSGLGHAADAPACSLQRIAEWQVKTDTGQLLVKMQVEGRDAWFLVDTGSATSMISAKLADDLQFHRLPIAGAHVVDAAGVTLTHYVRIKKLTVGNMIAEDKEFVVMGESSARGLPYDGVFGAGFLAAYDVELDLSHGKMTLFSQDHCKGQVVYWTQTFGTVPFTVDASLHIVMPVTLDGKPIKATLDTGATPSTISLQTARRTFDVDPEGAGDKPDGNLTGGSGTAIPFYRHRFDSLDIGGVAFHNTELQIIPDKTSRIMRDSERLDALPSQQHVPTSILLGLHHLSRIRAYIAYGERMLYISAADAN